MKKDTEQKVKGPSADRKGRLIDWKLLFNQLFALEIKKEHLLGSPSNAGDAQAFDEILRAYTLYNPATFNDAIDEISTAKTSDEAYQARVAFYENPLHRQEIAEFSLARSIGEDIRSHENIREFIEVIESNRERPIGPEENFFESPEGQNVFEAFRQDGKSKDQEVTFVFVPGFAGHTIKYALFEELVRDANTFYGRPEERPLLREDGIVLEFEDHVTYYGSGSGPISGLDILQPVGTELGNTIGFNSETTDLLYKWIQSLPEPYARTKLIFFGYSKGSSVVFDLVARYPDIASRLLGCVTFAGVVQGTPVAREVLEQADSLLRDVSIGEFVEQLRAEEPASLTRFLSPLFSELDLSWLEVPRIRAVFDLLGYDIGPLERQIDQVLGSRELREVLNGARELSPLERVRWNLQHLDNDTFRNPTYIFNISALTDVKDFVRPMGLRARGAGHRSLLVPALTSQGKLDWTQLSLDALFLYLTSIEGFKMAPAGLYDTQVDLANTKTPLLDRRPLTASLTAEEIEDLWQDENLRTMLRRNGVRSLQALAETPRCELIPYDRCDGIDAIDLGEFRGHHWTPFVQAIRPPPELSEEHAVWDFPRKAFMRAMLQVLAFYNLVSTADVEIGLSSENGEEHTRPRPSVIFGDEEHHDVVFFRTEGEETPREELVNLYNLGARALAYGLVANSARTGLGTSPPLGQQLESESLYFQGLRVYSSFDWEFKEGLLKEPSVWPLPRSLAIIVGRFPAEFASEFPEESVERLEKLRKSLKVLAPRLQPFELRRLGANDAPMGPLGRDVVFAQSIREKLWQGTQTKLAMIERDGYSTDGAHVESKLEAMLGAFTPLCTVFTAAFDEKAPERSSSRLTLYLPAFHTLHADDFDHPRAWYMEKGIHELELPKPVQLSTAEITHIRYLQEADTSKAQAIKIEIRRDFDQRDQVTTVASFGSLFDESSEELFGFDSSDHREALHVVFRPWFATEADENPADRAFREAFNRVFGAWQIEARIHQLTLRLRRRSHGSLDDDAVLRPKFSLQESRISFRVHRYVDTAVERLSLQAAGFMCEDVSGGTRRYHAHRDFWTWDHLLEEFFAGRSLATGRLRLPAYFRERLVEQLVGSATKAVVDRSIVAIEEAIDREIARAVDVNLKRYAKARAVLVDRLHDRISK